MRMRGRIVAVVGAVLAAVALVGGPAEAQQTIKIAAGVPLTGPLAKQGQEVANAVKLAVEEWNAKGGVLGKKIEVHGRRRPGQSAGRRGRGREGGGRSRGHGRRLGHHQRHLHPGLRGPAIAAILV